MVAESTAKIIGLKELQRAIKRNPQRVKIETKMFLQKGMAVYRRIIQNRPWRLGQSGGGAPVDTRSLLQSHGVKIRGFEAVIGPSRNYIVKYARYIHEGTKKMSARPWLDYAKDRGRPEIARLSRQLLKNIVKDLAK